MQLEMETLACRRKLTVTSRALDLITLVPLECLWPMFAVIHAAFVCQGMQHIQAGDGPAASLQAPNSGRSKSSAMPHKIAMDTIMVVCLRALHFMCCKRLGSCCYHAQFAALLVLHRTVGNHLCLIHAHGSLKYTLLPLQHRLGLESKLNNIDLNFERECLTCF
jgi:hypothetical protein